MSYGTASSPMEIDPDLLKFHDLLYVAEHNQRMASQSEEPLVLHFRSEASVLFTYSQVGNFVDVVKRRHVTGMRLAYLFRPTRPPFFITTTTPIPCPWFKKLFSALPKEPLKEYNHL